MDCILVSFPFFSRDLLRRTQKAFSFHTKCQLWTIAIWVECLCYHSALLRADRCILIHHRSLGSSSSTTLIKAVINANPQITVHLNLTTAREKTKDKLPLIICLAAMVQPWLFASEGYILAVVPSLRCYKGFLKCCKTNKNRHSSTMAFQGLCSEYGFKFGFTVYFIKNTVVQRQILLE